MGAKHPDIVKQMASKHEAWSKTLAPREEISKAPAKGPIIPLGDGWAIASEMK